MAKVTQQQLEAHLWAASDILRGYIDSSDYKNYIFVFLFLKRLSDVFEEEERRIEVRELEAVDFSNKALISREYPQKHRFFVSSKAHWSQIRKATHHLGDILNNACSTIEDHACSNLRGVLTGVDFNDARKLGDIQTRDTLFFRLVEHFSKLPLGNQNLSEPDIFGRAYEYLIERFADDAGKKGGEFYTPRSVVEVLVKILRPRKEMRICDPTCGSGGMLIECAHYLKEQGDDPADLFLFGQEKNLGTWVMCKMNMALHGLSEARIEKGDTIRDPKLIEDGRLMVFDRVIANPPFSLDAWGWDTAKNDIYKRFSYGIPTKNKGDLAFVQHMLASTEADGMVGVVLPHGVLFRRGAEGRIRKGFVEDDLFEAVIGLPPNLFYGTSIPAAILVFNRRKSHKRQGKVLFIYAAFDYEAGKNQNYLRPQDINHIVKAYQRFADEDKYAKVATLDEIRDNDYNLNISRYVDIVEEEERLDVREELEKLRLLDKERREAEAEMNALLKELGFC